MTENEFKLYLALGLLSPGVWGGKGEQWETLFEGSVTMKTDTKHNGEDTFVATIVAEGIVCDLVINEKSNNMRLTIDGVVHTPVVGKRELLSNLTGTATVLSFGNLFLGTSLLYSEEDTGENYGGTIANSIGLYTQYGGTHQVKVEYKPAERYLFNGIDLPRIPKYTQEAVDHVIIINRGNDIFELQMLKQSAYYVNEDGVDKIVGSVLELSEGITYRCAVGDSSWVEYGTTGYSRDFICAPSELVWTRENITVLPGSTVFMYGTPPIPVYA